MNVNEKKKLASKVDELLARRRAELLERVYEIKRGIESGTSMRNEAVMLVRFLEEYETEESFVRDLNL